LSQAAVGKAQLLLALVLGLGLAADCSELTILGYILPAAELQLCIDEHKKGWLVSITLLALAGGSLAWGILGDHLGRRRALISALSVAALFSAVATVMPTYGTFMTARSASRQPSRHVCHYELL
jgi:VNT family MFS transporter (synaptic vesicle glycoprotein 2)